MADSKLRIERPSWGLYTGAIEEVAVEVNPNHGSYLNVTIRLDDKRQMKVSIPIADPRLWINGDKKE